MAKRNASNASIPEWDGKDWGIKIPQNQWGLPVGETTFEGLAKQVLLNGRPVKAGSIRSLLRGLTYQIQPTGMGWMPHRADQKAPKYKFTTKGGATKSNTSKKQTQSASNDELKALLKALLEKL